MRNCVLKELIGVWERKAAELKQEAQSEDATTDIGKWIAMGYESCRDDVAKLLVMFEETSDE